MAGHSASLSLRVYDRAGARHAHAHHQAVLPAVGTLSMQVGDRAGLVDRTHGVLIPGDRLHAFAAAGENRFVVLDVPRGAGLPDGVIAAAARDPFFAIDAALTGLLAYLHETVAQGVLAGAAARHATALLTQAISRQMAAGPQPAPGIADALALVEARFAAPIAVADMAAAAGMGLSRFHEAFRRATATTPADYLTAVRLDHAALLLRTTRLPIADVALAVGFSDQSALTRAIRRRLGTTPARLRRDAAVSPR